ALQDKARVVLPEELPVVLVARSVVARVAPAPEQIAAVTLLAARVRRRLRGGGRVVDDVDLGEARRAEEDEVALGVERDGVRVEPVGIRPARTARAARAAARTRALSVTRRTTLRIACSAAAVRRTALRVRTRR